MALKLHCSQSNYAQWPYLVQPCAGLKAMGCLPPCVGLGLSHRGHVTTTTQDLGLDGFETAQFRLKAFRKKEFDSLIWLWAFCSFPKVFFRNFFLSTSCCWAQSKPSLCVTKTLQDARCCTSRTRPSQRMNWM